MRAAVGLTLLLFLAGCDKPPASATNAQILEEFQDADLRFTNDTPNGEHETDHRISVSRSKSVITVKAAYRSNGDGSFVLKNPQGNGARFDSFHQAKTFDSGEWFAERDPLAGGWVLSAHLTHGGAYAFGVYLD